MKTVNIELIDIYPSLNEDSCVVVVDRDNKHYCWEIDGYYIAVDILEDYGVNLMFYENKYDYLEDIEDLNYEDIADIYEI